MMNVMVLLICCSSLHITGLTHPSSSENLTSPEPKVGESLADLRLPFYTSGFE